MPKKKVGSNLSPQTQGIAVLGLGLGIIVIMLVIWGQEVYFGANAVPGEATVIDLREERRIRRRRVNYDHYVTYRFELPTPVKGMEVVEGEDLISEQTYRRLKIGQTVPIRYLMSDPTVSRLAPEMNDDRASGYVGVGAGLVAAVFLFSGVSKLREAQRNRNAQKHKAS